jgi:hypothetical protein
MIAGYPFFFLAWLAMISLIRSKYYWLWVIASIPISAVVYVVAFWIVFAIYWQVMTYYESRPEVIFADSFGFSPTPDVQIIDSSRDHGAKWDKAYLEFKADRSTIDRIVQNRFTPIPAKDYFETFGTPSWWMPDIDKPGTLIYVTNLEDLKDVRRDRRFCDHELLIYDCEYKIAYSRYRR